MADIPKWAENKKRYDQQYAKDHKRRIVIDLNRNTDPELIEIYELIPNKAQWFKDSLRRYAADHPEIYHTKEDPEDWPE